MGRPKSYERDDVCRRAMLVFWENGYERTTIGHLERTLSINRYGLFAEFGSKDGLFEAALDTYEREIVSANLAVLEADGANSDAIVAFFERFRDGTPEQALMGCMLCNASVECASNDAVRIRAQAYFERLRRAFAHALGELSTGVREATAAALTSAAVGAFVQARGGMSAAERERVLDGLIGWVRSLTPTAGERSGTTGSSSG